MPPSAGASGRWIIRQGKGLPSYHGSPGVNSSLRPLTWLQRNTDEEFDALNNCISLKQYSYKVGSSWVRRRHFEVQVNQVFTNFYPPASWISQNHQQVIFCTVHFNISFWCNSSWDKCKKKWPKPSETQWLPLKYIVCFVFCFLITFQLQIVILIYKPLPHRRMNRFYLYRNIFWQWFETSKHVNFDQI